MLTFGSYPSSSFALVMSAKVIGGSLASSIHGVPRSTVDVDIVVSLAPDRVEALAKDFGQPRQGVRRFPDL